MPPCSGRGQLQTRSPRLLADLGTVALGASAKSPGTLEVSGTHGTGRS